MIRKGAGAVSFALAGVVCVGLAGPVWAYDNSLRDPKTHSDCNNTKKMLEMTGADVHPHHRKKLEEIMKRCNREQKKIDAEKEKREGESGGGMSGY